MARSVPTGKFVDDSKPRGFVGTEFQSSRSLKNLRTGANRNLLIFGKTKFKVRNYDGKSCAFVQARNRQPNSSTAGKSLKIIVNARWNSALSLHRNQTMCWSMLRGIWLKHKGKLLLLCIWHWWGYTQKTAYNFAFHPVPEGYEETGEVQQRAAITTRDAEHMCCEERMREQGLINPEKRRLRGNLRHAYGHLKGNYKDNRTILFVVTPNNITRGSCHKLCLWSFRMEKKFINKVVQLPA